jgi:O-methyltransferase involved in polyketide biosynthesis
LCWYDLDLPDVISLWKKFIPENGRRMCISASFLDDARRKEIRAAENVLFVAAGLFYYFDERDVEGFFLRMADAFPGCEMFFDVSSPAGIRNTSTSILQKKRHGGRTAAEMGLEEHPRFAVLG